MLSAIKLPSSGVSQNKFFNGRCPMSRLLGPTIWKFVVQSNCNGAEINSVQVVTLIKHYDMVQESSTCGLKTALNSNRKPEYAERTPLVDFL